MKHKLLLPLILLFISIGSYSQKKKALTIPEQVWGTSSTIIEDTEIPEKWRNESAVYLSKTTEYTYNRPHNSIEYTKITHSRIKLLDQAAITEYSTFKYDKNITGTGIPVILNCYIALFHPFTIKFFVSFSL